MQVASYDFYQIDAECRLRRQKWNLKKETGPNKGQVKLSELFILNLSEYQRLRFSARPSVYTLNWVSFYSRFKNNDYRVVGTRRASGMRWSFCMERGETINLRRAAPGVPKRVDLT